MRWSIQTFFRWLWPETGRWSAVVLLALTVSVVATPVVAETFILAPGDDVIGALATIPSVYEDTLPDLGRRYGVGYEEMVRANPDVDVWLPGDGTEILFPTQYVLPRAPRVGIVVNLAEYRLYFFSTRNGIMEVSTFPISIGRMDWSTPLGRAAIVAKVRNPAWYPPASVRREHEAEGDPLPKVVPPGPDNPLGDYAMRLSVPGYLIHGTNKPDGVGMRVSHGCIRMYPEDIASLFPRVTLETPVELVNQPYKIGWSGNKLLLEVHPLLEENTEEEERGLTAITELYVYATRKRTARVDWQRVERVYAEKRGIPVVIGTAANPSPPAVAAD